MATEFSANSARWATPAGMHQLEPGAISSDVTFEDLGLDPMAAMEVLGKDRAGPDLEFHEKHPFAVGQSPSHDAGEHFDRVCLSACPKHVLPPFVLQAWAPIVAEPVPVGQRRRPVRARAPPLAVVFSPGPE